jgi:lysophospholipase L1-like esterase
VVHIGDSHVQAGFITQPVRKGLQEQYGNAGIGVIFPYRVAKSNGPPGYVSAADTPWLATRNAAIRRNMPTGISGFTIRATQTNPSFTLGFTTPEVLGRDTARLTLFHAPRDTCYTFSVTNELTGLSYPVVDSLSTTSTTFRIAGQPGKIRITGSKSNDSSRSAVLFGMNLTGEAAGVVVHTIGVNGATFENYLQAEYFTEQLALLHPDLLIISLGTNEAANYKTFDPAAFTNTIDSLMVKIGQAGVNASVLFTTPPGIYKGYRKKRRTYYKPNPAAESASKAIAAYAQKRNFSYWDWYAIMGGPVAMAKWKSKGMTDKRYIHFSSKGYGIQGTLLYEALMEQITSHP